MDPSPSRTYPDPDLLGALAALRRAANGACVETIAFRSQTMNLPEIIYTHVRALPADLQRETLDFIGFLEERYGLAPGAPRLTTQAFIEQFAGSLGDDFPDDIDDADLGQDVPRESFE